MKKLLDDCYQDAKNVLLAHRGLLDEVSEYLLAKETITGDELMAYVNAENKPANPEAPEAEAPKTEAN